MLHFELFDTFEISFPFWYFSVWKMYERNQEPKQSESSAWGTSRIYHFIMNILIESTEKGISAHFYDATSMNLAYFSGNSIIFYLLDASKHVTDIYMSVCILSQTQIFLSLVW
jgi:hypothetical protein